MPGELHVFWETTLVGRFENYSRVSTRSSQRPRPFSPLHDTSVACQFGFFTFELEEQHVCSTRGRYSLQVRSLRQASPAHPHYTGNRNLDPHDACDMLVLLRVQHVPVRVKQRPP